MTIRWTNTALAALAGLSGTAREEMFDRLNLAAEFPAMYPRRGRGLYRGCRYFVLRRRWIAYYRAAGDALLVLTIVPARARPS